MRYKIVISNIDYLPGTVPGFRTQSELYVDADSPLEAYKCNTGPKDPYGSQRYVIEQILSEDGNVLYFDHIYNGFLLDPLVRWVNPMNKSIGKPMSPIKSRLKILLMKVALMGPAIAFIADRVAHLLGICLGGH